METWEVRAFHPKAARHGLRFRVNLLWALLVGCSQGPFQAFRPELLGSALPIERAGKWIP